MAYDAWLSCPPKVTDISIARYIPEQEAAPRVHLGGSGPLHGACIFRMKIDLHGGTGRSAGRAEGLARVSCGAASGTRGTAGRQVPHRLKLASPMVGAATGFHTDQARRKVGEECCHLLAPQLLAQYRLSALVRPVHLVG